MDKAIKEAQMVRRANAQNSDRSHISEFRQERSDQAVRMKTDEGGERDSNMTELVGQITPLSYTQKLEDPENKSTEKVDQ